MTFWKREKYEDSKNIRGCIGFSVQGRDEEVKWEFYGGRIIFYDTGNISDVAMCIEKCIEL